MFSPSKNYWQQQIQLFIILCGPTQSGPNKTFEGADLAHELATSPLLHSDSENKLREQL